MNFTRSSIAQLSFQGIGWVLPAERELSPIDSVYCVTHLSGLDIVAPSPLAGEGLFVVQQGRLGEGAPLTQRSSLNVLGCPLPQGERAQIQPPAPEAR